jgi:hypothetical protein
MRIGSIKVRTTAYLFQETRSIWYSNTLGSVQIYQQLTAMLLPQFQPQVSLKGRSLKMARALGKRQGSSKPTGGMFYSAVVYRHGASTGIPRKHRTLILNMPHTLMKKWNENW